MNNTCYPISKIQNLYSMLNMHIVGLNYFIDSKDYENPIKPNYLSTINIGSSTASRTDVYFYKNTEVRTDEGWIMESFNIIPTIQFESNTNSIVPALPGDSIHFIIISIQDLKDIYSRKYLKLQDILASAGGFVKICLMFFSFFNNYCQSNKIFQTVYLNILERSQKNITYMKDDVIKHTNLKLADKNPSLANFVNIKNNTNHFSEFRKAFKKLSLRQLLLPCFKKSSNLSILEIIKKKVKKILSVESILVANYKMKRMNKVLWGEKGFMLLNYKSIFDFIYKLNSFDKVKENKKRSICDLNKVLLEIGESRKVDLHEAIRKEYRMMDAIKL
jgi:hypothetical protein